ncbi:MAG: NAD(P)/FAD-dependent oxidoreductase [Bacteroidetes bacterium]|nr:NAD(P)/FAD-dependent oxidoreductase [Bacteroidota bacterium]
MTAEENRYDVIIAGSGLGGLLCGVLLAKEGMRVCILEQSGKAGGCLSTFHRKGIDFDTGVHYFGSMDPGQPLHHYWDYIGLAGSVPMERMNPDGFDVIGFEDREYPLAMGSDHFIECLHDCFPGEKKILEKYMDELEEIRKSFSLYNLELPAGDPEEQYRGKSAFDFYYTLSQEAVNPAFRSRILSVLSGNNLLYAGSRERTPLHIPALINHSFISSAWKPVGGSGSIVSSLLQKIRESGGEVHLDSEVTGIGSSPPLFTVRTRNGNHFRAKNFISAIHPARTLELLESPLFRKSTSARITGLRNTYSSFALYLVMKEHSFPYLDHNYYFHKDENVWDEAMEAGWPSGYMLTTQAPATEDGFAKSMVILSPIPYSLFSRWEKTTTGRRGEEYDAFKQEIAERLLDLVEKRFAGLRSGISFMEISTPLTWHDYTGTPEGSMYGIERDYNNPPVTNILPVTKVPGFYFTGQNINLHGVLGVTIGAVQTCGAIVGLDFLLKKIKGL